MLAICRFCLIAALFWQSTSKASAVTVEEVRDAWRRHSDAIAAIEYQFQYSKTEERYVGINDDPFAPKKPGSERTVVLKGDMNYIRSGKRAAYTRIADYWNEQTGKTDKHTQRYCYDGAQNHSDYGGILGRIQTAPTMQDSLNIHVETIPLWWAHWPIERLSLSGDMDMEQMRITGEDLTCGTSPCIELTIEGKNKSKESIQLVYADPSKDYRIVRVIGMYKDAIRRDVNIEYAKDKKVGWTVAKFNSTTHDQEGNVQLFIESKVDACRANVPLSDDAFVVTFPVGTQLDIDGTYFVQEAEGMRRRIPAEEYGRIRNEGEYY